MSRFFLNLLIAMRSLENFRIRTILASLGVFLGTLSLIVVSGVTDSLTEKTENETRKLGDRLLIVKSGVVVSHGPRTRLMSDANTLTVDDARAIGDQILGVEAVSPSGSKVFPVRYQGNVLPATLVVGVTTNFPRVREFRPMQGAFWGEREERDLARVVVLGSKIAWKLFGNEDPVGRYVMVWRIPMQVVGVMEEKGADVSGADQDSQVFVPLSTFLHRIANRDYVDSIFVKIDEESRMMGARRGIVDILRLLHRISPGEKDDFTVIDIRDVSALKTQAMRMIGTLGTVSSIISFSIGGIGILSIMILIVNERRMEIGLRRAVGGRKRDIVFQFLTESSLISVAGGTAGMLAGMALNLVIFRVADLPVSSSGIGHLSAFAASVLIGILSGIYPARRATAIEPIEVLRS